VLKRTLLRAPAVLSCSWGIYLAPPVEKEQSTVEKFVLHEKSAKTKTFKKCRQTNTHAFWVSMKKVFL